MYHGRFKGTHYEAGFKWGELLYKNNNIISNKHTFIITEERKKFANQCLIIYEKYYPEILEEIKGIADGQKDSYENLYTFLLSMYCFEFNNHCTCMALKDNNNIILGRNSDFLVELEKLYMNCLYKLNNVYSFNGNTTAFVEMEDGINEYGLAIGLTFIYPKIINIGLNAGIIDNWKAKERYEVAHNSLKRNKNNFSIELVKEVLSGKYGFMCHYERKTNADTVWSVIYDTKNKRIYRVEGNPSRKKFKEDKRLKFS